MTGARTPRPGREALWSRQLALVVGANFVAFAAFGISLPVLPRFVIEELGRGDAVAGFVFGSYAIAAILVRPFVGRWGDRRGRRRLMLWGAGLMVVGLLAHVPADSVEVLVLARLAVGAGQATMVVGAATMTLDLAPASRQGEASTYAMVAVQTGLGLGPVVGELVLAASSYPMVWLVSAALAAVGGLMVLAIPADHGHPEVTPSRGLAGFVHTSAVAPGAVMALGMIGFVGYLAFIPLHAAEVGVEQVAPLFLLASLTIAGVRLVAARLPDRIGPVRSSAVALGLTAAGLFGLGLWTTPVGLYAMTFAMAAGTALVVPSLLVAAVRGVPVQERSRVMATYTIFIDIAGSVGPLALGAVAATATYGASFVVAAVAAMAAMVLLRVWLVPTLAVRERVNVDPPPDAAGA